MSTGVVKWYNERKGFGFITDNDTSLDVFVHFSQIADLDKKLDVGDNVSFNIKETDRGPAARIVKKV